MTVPVTLPFIGTSNNFGTDSNTNDAVQVGAGVIPMNTVVTMKALETLRSNGDIDGYNRMV